MFLRKNGKEGVRRPTENERKDVQKAMAYDLLKLLKADPGRTYTYEELETLIDAYISGLKQETA